jgi:hypothetical protein
MVAEEDPMQDGRRCLPGAKHTLTVSPYVCIRAQGCGLLRLDLCRPSMSFICVTNVTETGCA